jgi:hypothetical protein
MSYFLSFASDDHDAITDSDTVATTRGWFEFTSWALGLGEDFPVLTYFCEEGGLAEAEGIAQLEGELAEALREPPGAPHADVLAVGRTLLRELRGRPDDADAVCISDGAA